jgi:hypothetical protein
MWVSQKKHNALPGHTSPEKASEVSDTPTILGEVVKRDPGSITAPPGVGLSIPNWAMGVNIQYIRAYKRFLCIGTVCEDRVV